MRGERGRSYNRKTGMHELVIALEKQRIKNGNNKACVCECGAEKKNGLQNIGDMQAAGSVVCHHPHET